MSKEQKQRKMELYTVRPNLKQIYGRKVTKDLAFDEWTEDKTVHQVLKDRILTTEINKEYTVESIKVKEYSKTEVEYPEGTVLVWNEQIGYIMPQVQVYTLEELKEEIKDIEGIYDEINPGE